MSTGDPICPYCKNLLPCGCQSQKAFWDLISQISRQFSQIEPADNIVTRVCPKCHHEKARRTYSDRTFLTSAPSTRYGKESLIFTCLGCGYASFEQPLDHSKGSHPKKSKKKAKKD